MKWQGIVEFVAVAEARSFSVAARSLSISTAQVSRQITALEKRLQIKLFYRTTRSVSLTQEAQLYYEHCRNLLDGIDVAEQAITQMQSKPQGKIKLAASVTYGEKTILPLINDFISQHEGIEVTVELANHQIDLIEAGFDLAIRMGHQQDSSLIARKISQRRTFVCASQRYLEQFGVPQTLSDLKNHNCLMGTQDLWRFTENGKERSVKVSGNLRCNSGVALLDAALKDLGIVQLSDYFLQSYIESAQLIPILETYQCSEEEIWAVYPQNRYLSPKISHLIEYLVDRLP